MANTYVPSTDTLIIDGRNITSLANDRAINLTMPNDLVGLTKGVKKDIIVSPNADGSMGELTVRVFIASDDFKFLSDLQRNMQNVQGNFAVDGSYTQKKKRNGNTSKVTYRMTSMVVKTVGDAGVNSSTDANDEQKEFIFLVGNIETITQ